MELTEAQIQFMLARIDKRRLTNFHAQLSAYAAIHRVKIPSLAELSVVSSRPEESAFDPEKDAALEAAALKRLQERQKTNV